MRGSNVMSSKRLGFLTLTLVVLAIGSIFFVACTRPGTASTASGNGGNTPKTGGGGGGTTVHMGNSNFLVPSTTIPKGSKLTLIDDVAVPHIIQNGTYDANGTPKPAEEPVDPTENVISSGSDTKETGPLTHAGSSYVYHIFDVKMICTLAVS